RAAAGRAARTLRAGARTLGEGLFRPRRVVADSHTRAASRHRRSADLQLLIHGGRALPGAPLSRVGAGRDRPWRGNRAGSAAARSRRGTGSGGEALGRRSARVRSVLGSEARVKARGLVAGADQLLHARGERALGVAGQEALAE